MHLNQAEGTFNYIKKKTQKNKNKNFLDIPQSLIKFTECE